MWLSTHGEASDDTTFTQLGIELTRREPSFLVIMENLDPVPSTVLNSCLKRPESLRCIGLAFEEVDGPESGSVVDKDFEVPKAFGGPDWHGTMQVTMDNGEWSV